MISKLKTRLTTSGVLLSVFFLPVMAQDGHYYIDAGTASLIIQFLIAGAVGGFFFIKIFWGKIKAFFNKLFAGTGKGTK